MGRRVAAALVLLAISGLIYFLLNKSDDKAYHVFINTTSDHRFDDSIRVTILANHQRAHIQNAVVILQKLPEALTLQETAAQLFDKLRLGRATKGRAVLYLFVPSEKALKIEVGYALEGILPDSKVKFLEEAAKSFTYNSHMHDFWADLINTVNVVVQKADQGQSADYDFSNWAYLSGGAGLSSATYERTAEQLRREIGPVRDHSEFEPQESAVGTLTGYLASLQKGVTDADLALLSTGSRIYRSYTPRNRALVQRLHSMYQAAMPFEIAEADGHAVVWFQRKNPVLPIFLFKNESGLWLVHEPYSYSVFNRFEDSLDFFQTQPTDDKSVFRKMPVAAQPILWGAPKFSPRPHEGRAFFDRLLKLEEALKSGSAESYFAIGDFYLFEMAQFDKSLENYKIAADKDPKPDYLWKMMAAQMATGSFKDFKATYARLARLQPGDLRLQETNSFYQKQLTFDESEWIREVKL